MVWRKGNPDIELDDDDDDDDNPKKDSHTGKAYREEKKPKDGEKGVKALEITRNPPTWEDRKKITGEKKERHTCLRKKIRYRL